MAAKNFCLLSYLRRKFRKYIFRYFGRIYRFSLNACLRHIRHICLQVACDASDSEMLLYSSYCNALVRSRKPHFVQSRASKFTIFLLLWSRDAFTVASRTACDQTRTEIAVLLLAQSISTVLYHQNSLFPISFYARSVLAPSMKRSRKRKNVSRSACNPRLIENSL